MEENEYNIFAKSVYGSKFKMVDGSEGLFIKQENDNEYTLFLGAPHYEFYTYDKNGYCTSIEDDKTKYKFYVSRPLFDDTNRFYIRDIDYLIEDRKYQSVYKKEKWEHIYIDGFRSRKIAENVSNLLRTHFGMKPYYTKENPHYIEYEKDE